MNDDWCYALRAVSEGILEQAGIIEPPIDAFKLAERLHVTVAVDDAQTVRGRLKTLNGERTAFLRPDDRPERLQWALAHEIGEAMAWKVAERTEDVATISPGHREEIANQLASRILLPDGWFFADAALLDDNLFALKQRYSSASYALLAMRLLDRRSTPTVITISDQGRVSCRKSNFGSTPPRLPPDERGTLAKVNYSGQPLRCKNHEKIMRVWPIHEPEWKREIAVTTLLDGSCEWE